MVVPLHVPVLGSSVRIFGGKKNCTLALFSICSHIQGGSVLLTEHLVWKCMEWKWHSFVTTHSNLHIPHTPGRNVSDSYNFIYCFRFMYSIFYLSINIIMILNNKNQNIPSSKNHCYARKIGSRWYSVKKISTNMKTKFKTKWEKCIPWF